MFLAKTNIALYIKILFFHCIRILGGSNMEMWHWSEKKE